MLQALLSSSTGKGVVIQHGEEKGGKTLSILTGPFVLLHQDILYAPGIEVGSKMKMNIISVSVATAMVSLLVQR